VALIDHEGTTDLLFFFFGVAEKPFNRNAFALGIANNALTITTELWVVAGQEHQTGQHTGTELREQGVIAVAEVDLPMRRHGAEIHDSSVGSWLNGCVGHDSLLAYETLIVPDRLGFTEQLCLTVPSGNQMDAMLV
jgi:hypothetical protein